MAEQLWEEPVGTEVSEEIISEEIEREPMTAEPKEEIPSVVKAVLSAEDDEVDKQCVVQVTEPAMEESMVLETEPEEQPEPTRQIIVDEPDRFAETAVDNSPPAEVPQDKPDVIFSPPVKLLEDEFLSEPVAAVVADADAEPQIIEHEYTEVSEPQKPEIVASPTDEIFSNDEPEEIVGESLADINDSGFLETTETADEDMPPHEQLFRRLEQFEPEKAEEASLLVEAIEEVAVEIEDQNSDRLEENIEAQEKIEGLVIRLFEVLDIEYSEEDIKSFAVELTCGRDAAIEELELTNNASKEKGTNERKSEPLINLIIQKLKQKLDIHISLGNFVLVRLSPQTID